MDLHPIVPSVALVINLSSSTAEQTEAAARSLASKLQTLQLPATWVIADAQQAKTLASGLLAASGHEMAIAVTARSPQRLRTELSTLQSTALATSGQTVCVVGGDPQQLRSRASLLAHQGIVAIVSESSSGTQPTRQLPCGLWQFDPTLSFPQPRKRWSFLPARRPSLKQILAADGSGHTHLAAVDVSQASTRDLQNFDALLQDLAPATRQQELNVATVSELAAQLASQHEVKPQRSILRRAA